MFHNIHVVSFESVLIAATLPWLVLIPMWIVNGGFDLKRDKYETGPGVWTGLLLLTYGLATVCGLVGIAIPTVWRLYVFACAAFCTFLGLFALLFVPARAWDNAQKARRLERELNELRELHAKMKAERRFVLATDDGRWVAYDEFERPSLIQKPFFWTTAEPNEYARGVAQQHLHVKLEWKELKDSL